MSHNSLVNVWSGIFKAQAGRFFSVVFVKQDGSLRRLTGNVGRDLVIDRTNHLIVNDVQHGGFRKISLNDIVSFKSGKLIING